MGVLTVRVLCSGEMLLFGGEYYDGEVSTCYNGVYRWHIEKQEWRVVESINTPPPRCSHQVPIKYYVHTIYIIYMYYI